jgi:HD-like signal output (HDOD) protein
VDHAWAAAKVLHAWDFPSSLCDAVARHHEAASSSLLSPLPAALLAARALAAMVPGTESHDPTVRGPAGQDALLVAGIGADEAVAMADVVRKAATDLASALVV